MGVSRQACFDVALLWGRWVHVFCSYGVLMYLCLCLCVRVYVCRVDPTGEFRVFRSFSFFSSFQRFAKTIIADEIRDVVVAVKERQAKLKLASNLHIGLEILHLFVLDILGRHSSAAKIFSAKSTGE